MSAGHNAEALRKTSNGLIRIFPIEAEQRDPWSDLYLSPHMGSLLSFVIKSLVLRPRKIKRAKHPWGTPSLGGDHASLALFPFIPSFPSQHPIFSWLLLSCPCSSCLCLASRVSKAGDILRGSIAALCTGDAIGFFSFFQCNLKKKNSASHSIINAYEH